MAKLLLLTISLVIICYTFATASFINPANNHEYALTSSEKIFLDAEAEAVAWGGHLVTINDQAEQLWLESVFAATVSYGEIYIGINDIATERGFVWTSGEPVTYTNWHAGEPNDSKLGAFGDLGEDAGTLWRFGDGTWNDTNQGHTNYGIMERSAEPIPEPSTILLLTTGVAGIGAYSFRKKRKKP